MCLGRSLQEVPFVSAKEQMAKQAVSILFLFASHCPLCHHRVLLAFAVQVSVRTRSRVQAIAPSPQKARCALEVSGCEKASWPSRQKGDMTVAMDNPRGAASYHDSVDPCLLNGFCSFPCRFLEVSMGSTDLTGDSDTQPEADAQQNFERCVAGAPS
jgi:hypothetical protein